MKRIPACSLQGLMAALAVAVLLLPDFAHAYVGPGAGLTALGTVIALFAAVALAVVGFVWYPLKRILRRSPSANARANEETK